MEVPEMNDYLKNSMVFMVVNYGREMVGLIV